METLYTQQQTNASTQGTRRRMNSPSALMSTVSAQAAKRATSGEQAWAAVWFSRKQRSNRMNSPAQSVRIF